jgi:hypothetical protein
MTVTSRKTLPAFLLPKTIVVIKDQEMANVITEKERRKKNKAKTAALYV